ncbi:MAG TPA: GldG family protein [Thermoflexia bacterium]|nr:GldG family protein [Thermoflexia bacterium]
MMRRFAERYGFILGYLALAALVAGAARYLIWREMDAWARGLLAGGVVLGALFVLARPAQVRAALTRRATRYGSNAVVMSIAFIGILVMVNYLAGRYHYRYDATELKEHTLSPQSVQVLAEVDKPVTIIGFFAADDYRREAFEKLLDQYLYRSDYLSYSVIDPDREPLKARQYEPIPYGGLLLQSGERTETVYTPDEQDITSALLKVTSEEQKVIYFLTGHQEHDLKGYGDDGYSQVADALRDQNYAVRTLNLAVTTTVPSDAAVVVIAGPQTAFMNEEISRLRSYLIRGGKALIMQDPLYDAGLNDILSIWQVRFGDGVVIDPASSLLGGVAAPVVSGYRFSQITKDLPMTFFPLARPVEQTGEDTSGAITFSPLAETTPQSWAEQNTESEQVRLDEGVDTPGPLTLVATIEAMPALGSEEMKAHPDLKTRLVLIGDSDFASNKYVRSLGNGLLFLNTVNWLAEEERLIAIGPKSTQPRQVFLSQVQANAIFFTGVVLIPLALLATGVVVWWRRR